MKFSEKIIKLRKENGLSQEEFGDKINVSRQAISKWESEQSQPEVEKIKEISKIFGVSIEYLLNDKLENENIKKVHKFNKKKLFKTIFKITVVLITIYLIYCLYKFILLWNHYNNIQQIPDFSEYECSTSFYYEDKMTKEIIKMNDLSKSSEKIEFMNVYSEFSGHNSIKYNTIAYMNKEKNQEFYLAYDEEKEKFIYSKEVEEQFEELLKERSKDNPTSAIKENSMNHFLDSGVIGEDTQIFVQILKASINPTILVNQDYIKYLYKDGYRIIELDRYDGRVYRDYELTDTIESITLYDYSFPDYDFQNVESLKEFAELLGIEV